MAAIMPQMIAGPQIPMGRLQGEFPVEKQSPTV
jgi:hypothetical protein